MSRILSGGGVPEISDSWETIIQKINNGTADYEVGECKSLDLGTEGVVRMQIVGSAKTNNSSPLASGNGYATYDWVSIETLATYHTMNSTSTAEGGWGASEMRTYLKETIKPLIPTEVRNAIKEVTKYSLNPGGGTVTSTEDIWLPSVREIFSGAVLKENNGPVYKDAFDIVNNRIKKNVNGDINNAYWDLRSAYNDRYFYAVNGSGAIYQYGGNGVTLYFSL